MNREQKHPGTWGARPGHAARGAEALLKIQLRNVRRHAGRLKPSDRLALLSAADEVERTWLRGAN